MERFDDPDFPDTLILSDTPNSLPGILEPEAALAAARRMQRWYKSTPQGVAHSMFGRDGRRIEGRLELEHADDGA